MYSTTSMLRTIELILGMPPMTQYDAAADADVALFQYHRRSFTIYFTAPGHRYRAKKYCNK